MHNWAGLEQQTSWFWGKMHSFGVLICDFGDFMNAYHCFLPASITFCGWNHCKSVGI